MWSDGIKQPRGEGDEVQLRDALDHPRLDELDGAAGIYQSPGWLRASAKMSPGPSRFASVPEGLAALYLVPSAAAGRYGLETFLDEESIASLGYRQEQPLALFLGRAGYCSDLSRLPGSREGIDARLLRALGEEARRLGAGAGALSYLPPSSARRLVKAGVVDAAELVLQEGAVAVDLEALESYPAGLAASRRGIVRRDERRYRRAGLRTERRKLSQCLEFAAPLLAETVQHHGGGISPQVLERVMAEQARQLDDHSLVVASRNEAGEVVAYSLSYRWGSTLYVRLVGLRYSATEGSGAYFQVAYTETIRWALEQQLETVELGIGTLVPKLLRGGRLEPRYGVFRGPEGQRLPAEAVGQASRRTWRRLEKEVKRVGALETLWSEEPTLAEVLGE
ncbi:MAG: GNAT family N-acetyltransferase [Acidobacteriota bacterium]